ncbi:MAG: IMP dehydrogenase [Caldisericaceae bacterium]|nr:IMP dehydrogenase [Caldisericaceae bacterium]
MKSKSIKESLTFDDVLLVPRYSEIMPTEANLQTYITDKVKLNIPIISAAMDTVTESRMAISLAREGGIGIIHRNMDAKRQAEEVDKVKKSESGIITDPIYVHPDTTVSEAETMMAKYRISGLPVVDRNMKLLGIVTNRDLRFVTSSKESVKDYMTSGKNLITAPVGTSLPEAKEILQKYKIEKLPLVDKEMKLKGLITIKDIMKKIKYPNACKDEKGRLCVGAAIGVGEDALHRAKLLLEAGVDVLVIDTAHGHSKKVLATLSKLRSVYPNFPIIAGNIATAEGAESLIKAGASAVKVGVGPGSICITRIVAGVGVAQFSAIRDVYGVTKKYHIPLISDGGINYSGDIVKALAAGADAVMIGSLLAGTDEAPGEIVIYGGRSYKEYRGMGSQTVLKEGKSSDRYFVNPNNREEIVPEGIEGRVPYKGPLRNVIHQLKGGIRSGMGYCGSRTIEELKEKASFVRITYAGLRESHPHNVEITKEAPNYWRE